MAIATPMPIAWTRPAVPRTAICSLQLSAYERWFANSLVTRAEAEALVPPTFLEPRPGPEGFYLLSLCCIFLDHAAPTPGPRWLGPASRNCALRIACTDRRDGSPAVWIDQRHTDSPWAVALDLIGFPPPLRRLLVERDAAPGDRLPSHLRVRSHARDIDLDLRAGRHSRPLAFADAAAMDAYIDAGTRGYGPGPRRGWYSAVELEKTTGNRFHHLGELGGRLRAAGAVRGVDGVYLTRDGRYRWTHRGWCDDDGTPLTRTAA